RAMADHQAMPVLARGAKVEQLARRAGRARVLRAHELVGVEAGERGREQRVVAESPAQVARARERLAGLGRGRAHERAQDSAMLDARAKLQLVAAASLGQ